MMTELIHTGSKKNRCPTFGRHGTITAVLTPVGILVEGKLLAEIRKINIFSYYSEQYNCLFHLRLFSILETLKANPSQKCPP
jgi:hypothetical protein